MPKQGKVLSEILSSGSFGIGWGWPRATLKLKERMRLIGEYPLGHFLEISGKLLRRKSNSQIGFISLRLTAMFGNLG